MRKVAASMAGAPRLLTTLILRPYWWYHSYSYTVLLLLLLLLLHIRLRCLAHPHAHAHARPSARQPTVTALALARPRPHRVVFRPYGAHALHHHHGSCTWPHSPASDIESRLDPSSHHHGS